MWGTVGRLVGVLGAVAATGAWALLPASSGQEPAAALSGRATEHRSTVEVSADGTLEVVETLLVELSGDDGQLSRFWDVIAGDRRTRLVPRSISATVDGTPAPVDTSWQGEGRFRQARIGVASEDLTGAHRYELRYTVAGALQPAGEGAELDWDVVAGWPLPIDNSIIDLRLPESPQGVVCSAGCAVAQTDSLVRLEAADLEPYERVRAAVSLPDTAADTHRLLWPLRLDPVLGRSIPDAAIWAGVSLLALVVGALALRVTRQRAPAEAEVETPPDDVGPVQAAWCLTAEVAESAGVATLLHLAQGGLVRIVREDDRWLLRNFADEGAWADVDQVSRTFASRLGLLVSGGVFTLDDEGSRRRLGRAIRHLEGDVWRWSYEERYVAPDRVVQVLRWLLAPLGVAAVVLIGLNPQRMSLVGLPFALLFVMLLTMLAPSRSRRRTAKGRALYAHAAGLRRVLCGGTGGIGGTAQDPIGFEQHPELYTHYLPWAVGFGCADAWTARFRAEVHREPRAPAGLAIRAGSTVPAVGPFGGEPVLASLTGAVSSAAAAYARSEAKASTAGGAHAAGRAARRRTVSAGSEGRD